MDKQLSVSEMPDARTLLGRRWGLAVLGVLEIWNHGDYITTTIIIIGKN